jgi:hypothetical protein
VSFGERAKTAMRLTLGSIQPTDGSRRCRTGRRRDGRGPASGGECASSETAAAAMVSPVSASASPARARGREKKMSASEGVEVAARCSIPRLGSRRGGDGSARSTRGDALLPERHDMPVFELVD